MRILLPICLLLLVVPSAMAQLLSFPMKGKFYVSVDDRVTLYRNGVQIHRAGIGQSQSPEILIEPNDRILVHLLNTGGPKKFAMIFVSSDQKTVLSFRNQMLKVVPDPTKTDFTRKEFDENRKFAEQLSRKEVDVFAYNNTAEWLWGVGNPCVLAAVIQQDQFKPLQK